MASPGVDDARHPLLSRARPLAQTSIEAFLRQDAARASLLPAAEEGTYHLREVEARSALTASGLPGEPWSLNPYVGCSHDCAYCFVPDTMRVERERWGRYVLVKRNLPALLRREVARKERRPVFLASATDAYQPAERECLVTRRSLEVLARADWPVRILTRSPLIKRDLDLLTRFSDILVGLTVPTLDDDLRRAVEPAAPPIEGRLAALRALADAGLRPFVNYVPAYPLVGRTTVEDLARRFREAGVAAVHAGAWQYLATVLDPVRARLPPDIAEEFARKVQDPAYVADTFRALAQACRREGVRFELIGPAPVRFAKRELRWVEGASGRQPDAAKGTRPT